MEGLGERFETATLWSTFFGVEHRATKCNDVVGRWGEGECAEDRRWTDGGVDEVVRIRNLHGGTAEVVPKVATGADQRVLEVQVNMEGYSKRAADKASAEVEVTARAMRQMASVKWLVEGCGEAEIVETAQCSLGGGKGDLPAIEEGIPAEDGATSRDSSSSGRLVCVDG